MNIKLQQYEKDPIYDNPTQLLLEENKKLEAEIEELKEDNERLKDEIRKLKGELEYQTFSLYKEGYQHP
jgi:cell division protein FtsB